MKILILLLLITNICLSFAILNNAISDLVNPVLYCLDKNECEEIINGEVDCINKSCSCVNNTKFNKHKRGCYKKVGFGDICHKTPECITPGSVCEYADCDKKTHKRCVCRDDAELISGSCQRFKNKFARKCCEDKDCSFDKMYCNKDTQKCECRSNFFFHDNTCVSYTELNICRNDDDCSYIENLKCSKIKGSSIGKCECGPNFFFHNNTCVSHTELHICRNDDDCSYIENFKCSKIKGSWIRKCKCRPSFYFHENICVPHIDLNICQNDDDCTHTENLKCSKIKGFPLGKCECGPNYYFHNNTCVSLSTCKTFIINEEYSVQYNGIKDNLKSLEGINTPNANRAESTEKIHQNIYILFITITLFIKCHFVLN